MDINYIELEGEIYEPDEPMSDWVPLCSETGDMLMARYELSDDDILDICVHDPLRWFACRADLRAETVCMLELCGHRYLPTRATCVWYFGGIALPAVEYQSEDGTRRCWVYCGVQQEPERGARTFELWLTRQRPDQHGFPELIVSFQ